MKRSANINTSPPQMNFSPAESGHHALHVSEARYRRLFETMQDGILLLNANTGQIEDVNPYLIKMLGYSHEAFIGKKLWEVGTFADIAESKETFAKLQSKGYARYENLPLKTKAGDTLNVEVVANSYDCEGTKVIQCNIRDITARRLAEANLAYYDLLTGLANRRLFGDRVEQIIRVKRHGQRKFAVLMINLDRFKNINDSLGRPAGDALLKQVAVWLAESRGGTSLISRLGADHFGVILPDVTADRELARLTKKIFESLAAQPFDLQNSEHRVSATGGIALFLNDGTDANTLLSNAEAALKEAKASGKRYMLYTEAMTNATEGKVSLETRLREAFEKDQFVLHYQPKVNLESGKITGAEALIRWNDPRTGLMPPGGFIPSLEESGLIYEVGRWALGAAVKDYLRWRAAGIAVGRIAVNVSPIQMSDPDFVADLEEIINIDAHAAAGLELEITEGMAMLDISQNIDILQAIRALGITVAIDDFGTGYSSLGYLTKLPIDTLKIDRSFIVEMTQKPEGLAIVSTIISLAHGLKLKVIAEGVETEEQSRLLRLLACDEIQGFFFSKPVPGEVFKQNFGISAE